MSRFYSFRDTDKIQPVVEEEMAIENNKRASGIRTVDFFFFLFPLLWNFVKVSPEVNIYSISCLLLLSLKPKQ